MATMDDLFREYLGKIEPSDEAVARASNAHNPLREDLEKDEVYGPYVAKTLVSGSYGRDTSIFSIKDVDVIIETTFTEGILQEKKKDDETVQECLLRLTQEAIRRTGRSAYTRRRSIHVKLPHKDDDPEDMPELTMDIVPVMVPWGEGNDPMTIADHELAEWYDTYPETQLSDSVARNKASQKIGDRHLYKPLVKIFRAWRRVHFFSNKTPKGFVLECMTAQYHNRLSEHWIDGVYKLFGNICAAYPDPDSLTYIPEVRDISNSAPNTIPIAKTVDEAKGVLKKIHAHYALVGKAKVKQDENLFEAAKILQQVFGDDCEDICFPLPEKDEKEGRHGPNPFERSGSRSNIREAPDFG